jgi:hypothetical protein
MFVPEMRDDDGEVIDPRDVAPPAQSWLNRAALPRFESILNARPEAHSEANQLELLHEIAGARATLDWMLCKTASSLACKDAAARSARRAAADNASPNRGRSKYVNGHEQARTLGAAGTPEVGEFLLAEIALELGVSERTASDYVAVGMDLRYRLPITNAELAAGRLTFAHARVISEATRPLDDDSAARLDETLAEGAGQRSPARLRIRARRAAARIDPTAFERQHKSAYAERTATAFPTDHGMAAFSIEHRLETVCVIDDHVEDWARRRRLVDPLTSLVTHRADAAAHLLLGQHPLTGESLFASNGGRDLAEAVRQAGNGSGVVGPAGTPCPGAVATDDHQEGQEIPAAAAGRSAALPDPGEFLPARVELRLTMSADTLLGLDEANCELDGRGPITAAQARRLALTNCGSTTLRRVFSDPADNSVMFLDAQRYTFTSRQKEAILALHPLSCFPGATRPGQACDIDHRRPYIHGPPASADGAPRPAPPGQTVVSNGQPLARRHHRIKTHGGWQCEVDPADPHTMIWTTARGRVHICRDHDGA